MNKRTFLLLQQLAQSRLATLEQLATQFKTSTRTIRKDIDMINDCLIKAGADLIYFGNEGEVCSDKAKNHLNDIPKMISLTDYRLSREERLILESYFLLVSLTPITIKGLSRKMYLSRNTVVNDLPSLRSFLTQNELILKSDKQGLIIEGSESQKRLLLMHHYISLSDNDFLREYLFPSEDDPSLLISVVRKAEKQNQVVFRDYSFQYVQTYLSVLCSRSANNLMIETEGMFHFSAFSLIISQSILEDLSQKVRFPLSLKEVEFLAFLIGNLTFVKKSSPIDDSFKIQFLTRQFIKQISGDIAYDLTQDISLLENLSKHMETIFYNQPLQAPDSSLLTDIIESNKSIVTAIKKHLSIFHILKSKVFEPNDIYYIAIHICGAVERQRLEIAHFKVLLACHAGIGTSMLLKQRLKEHFNFDIIDVVTIHEAEEEQHRADFIITTVPLQKTNNETIVVSASLTETDIIRINTLMRKISKEGNVEENPETSQTLFKDLLPILKKIGCEQKDLVMIRQVINRHCQKSMSPFEESMAHQVIQLSDLLTPNYIVLQGKASSWEESIRQSARLLREESLIEESYVEAMIANVLSYGPYILIAKGVAVAHAGIDDGVNGLGMSLYRLDKGVNFGNPELDPIRYIICLCVTDYGKHVTAFNTLLNLFQDSSMREKLDRVDTAKDCYCLIKKYEEKEN
ncbi:BglG family transcription antiterminator [Streptococcus agalactiae]|uniref:BglG family transcription antiterminator n=1 Tax=Streptococcus agalactiae TaxID=1311 RepID=UPI000332E6D9|nr:PTS sugar transporter subunit IIA [Streptococcus agalactiae]CCW39381.1 Predicted galactitol operon regulator (Transcriptional antiterminator), BglG family / PTS system, mannitol/fructose-specific IIA component [Streptococcus agalactiae ILRI005]